MAGDEVPSYVFLLRAKNVIDRRYAEPLDVATLARSALVSRAHFIRSFRRAFGVTPHRYLTERRIERAMELLRSGRVSVTQACVEVGFASLGSFSAAFRAHVGEAPSDYAGRHRDQPPPIPACFLMMGTRPAGRALPEKRHARDGSYR